MTSFDYQDSYDRLVQNTGLFDREFEEQAAIDLDEIDEARDEYWEGKEKRNGWGGDWAEEDYKQWNNENEDDWDDDD